MIPAFALVCLVGLLFDACHAELSLLGTKSFLQIWTPIECNDHVRIARQPSATTSADLHPPFDADSLNCAWKRLQFDYRLLMSGAPSNVVRPPPPTINLISGELVSVPTSDNQTLNVRLAFHVLATGDGQLSCLLPPAVPLQVTSGSSSSSSSSSSSLSRSSALEIRRVRLSVLESGLRVSIGDDNSTTASASIQIQVLSGTWRLSRRVRIGQTLALPRPSPLNVSSSVAQPLHSVCLSNLRLNARLVSLSVEHVLRRWSNLNAQQVSTASLTGSSLPFRLQIHGQVSDGCSTSSVACRPACLHGAACHTDLYGVGHCGCEGVGYTGNNCYFRTYSLSLSLLNAIESLFNCLHPVLSNVSTKLRRVEYVGIPDQRNVSGRFGRSRTARIHTSLL
jgi:hypothetical protein